MKLAAWLTFVVLVASACGAGAGGSRAPATLPAGDAEGAFAAFHEVLAPLWDSPASARRTDRTCAAVPTLEARAQDVGDAPLVEAVNSLAAECTGDRAAFEPRLAAVHDAFQAAKARRGQPRGR